MGRCLRTFGEQNQKGGLFYSPSEYGRCDGPRRRVIRCLGRDRPSPELDDLFGFGLLEDKGETSVPLYWSP